MWRIGKMYPSWFWSDWRALNEPMWMMQGPALLAESFSIGPLPALSIFM